MVSSRSRNVELESRMLAKGMTAAELADAMNAQIRKLCGREGDLTSRTIRRYLSGQTRWPQERQRRAAEAVFGCSAERLGFQPPAPPAPQAPPAQEDPLQRRSLFAAVTATAAALAPAVPASATPRIGSTDVDRFRARLDRLSASDDHHGGTVELERDALVEGQRALDLLQHAQASDRVRGQVYSVGADAFTAAAWAAIDSQQLDRAQAHLDRALALAGLSSDPVSTLRAWNNIAMLAAQRGRHVDAHAAARTGRHTFAARRDPLYLSLCHARGALAQAATGDGRAALRSIGHAESALERATDEDRPAWTRFYDRAELHGLSSIVQLRLGRPDQAEYHVHNTLAGLRPALRRNRAYYTAHLAIAQVRQGELEQACHTADTLMTKGLPGSARVRELLQDFRTEAAATGSARARTWLNDTRQ